MATILLVFIYIFYIGLGIPDSLLGAAWPAIYGDLSVPISYASLVSVIISCGTVLSNSTCNGTLNKPHCNCAAWIFFFTKFFMALYLCGSIRDWCGLY